MKKVLICDDIQDIAELLKFTLELEGYIVETAYCATGAISKIQQDIPDLLVTDMMMPGMTGYDLVCYVENNLNIKNLPVLFLTAMDDISLKKETKKNISQVIFKPLDVDEFVKKIKLILE